MRTLLRRTRVRLTAAVATAFLAVAAAVAAAGVWFTFSHLEYNSLDTSLSNQSRSLLSGLQESDGSISFHGGDSQGGDPLPSQTSEGTAVNAALFAGSGRVLDHSGSALKYQTVISLAAESRRTGQPTTGTVSEAGLAYRVRAELAAPGNGGTVMVVSRPLHDLQEALLLLGLMLAGIVTVLVAAASFLAYRLAGRALHPVRLIAATARDISEHDLHRRLGLDLPPDELGELADTFNGMLARLESAFTSLQRFTADAAHEFRAPLALLRAELEVSLSQARTEKEYRASQALALSEVERLSALADRLLMLSRADAGVLRPTFESVDIGDLIDETAERWRPPALRRGVEIRTEINQDVVVLADPELLRRLLDNLLDNAVRHTPDAGAVTVRVEDDADEWSLMVSDTGAGIPAEQRKVLFERFTRGDPARGRQSGGAGLGLALCHAIAELHGGTISIDDVRSGATLRCRLPRRPPAMVNLVGQPDHTGGA